MERSIGYDSPTKVGRVSGIDGDVAIGPEGSLQALDFLSRACGSNTGVDWFSRVNARTASTESKNLITKNSTSSVFHVHSIRDNDGARRGHSF
jgi:hypothetical protein